MLQLQIKHTHWPLILSKTLLNVNVSKVLLILRQKNPQKTKTLQRQVLGEEAAIKS